MKLFPFKFSAEDAIPHSPSRISNSTPFRSALKSKIALHFDSPTSTYAKFYVGPFANFQIDLSRQCHRVFIDDGRIVEGIESDES